MCDIRGKMCVAPSGWERRELVIGRSGLSHEWQEYGVRIFGPGREPARKPEVESAATVADADDQYEADIGLVK